MMNCGAAHADVMYNGYGIAYSTGSPGSLTPQITAPGTGAVGGPVTISFSVSETPFGGSNLSQTVADNTCTGCELSYQQLN